MKKKIKTFTLIVFLFLLISGCTSIESKKHKENKTLTVFNYSEYINPSVLDIFYNETGIKIKYEEGLTPEEMYTKYKSKAIKYDIICTSDYMLKRLIEEHEIQEINFEQFQYKENIGKQYWKLSDKFDKGNTYSLPYFWGTLGILYDKTKVSKPVDSWEVLFNKEYSGQIIMPNSMRDIYMIALKYLGYSVNTTNPDEIQKAHDLLSAQKPDVQAYLVDESRDEVVAGNSAMAVIYSGEAYLAHQYNENLKYVIPKEGSNIWIDSWAITQNCQNKENAEKFLDFLCREDIAKLNFEYIYYSTPNTSVINSLSEEDKNNEAIVPKDNSLTNCELCIQTDKTTNDLLNELWKKLKSN